MSNMKKEMVGYCILDLRTAPPNANKVNFNLVNNLYFLNYRHLLWE